MMLLIISILAVAGVLLAPLWVFGLIGSVIWKFLAPVVIAVVIIALVIKFFKKRKK